ncbi:MAG: FG-GAP-like repeat-containing protein [Acidobacteriia bacterium]|nr:FG-GAP-like repeat-containing protein [Terriglobia bacterium]
MTTADFNRDGRPDVALVTVAGTVAVLLGRVDGTFDPGRDIIRDPLPARFVIAADVNGDGRPDLISTHQIANVVSVALGRGDGTFLPAMQFPCGAAPYGVVAADFNGDGKLDLAVANNSGLIPSQPGTTVTVLLGKGDGTFGAPQPSAVLGQRPYTLAAGDFNQDGKADLVVVNSGSPEVSILISKGDGTFQAPSALQVLPFSISGAVAVADFNQDSWVDIAVLTPPRVTIWLGNGDGSFQQGADFAFDGLQLITADINADGVPDLVGMSPIYGVAIVVLGNGDGSFEDQQPFPAGNLPTDIAAGDFNGDGVLDLVLCHQSEPSLTVLLNSTPTPAISANGVVNAASFLAGPLTVAAGEIVTIFGRNLGPPQLVPARLRSPEFLDTTLDYTRVFFDGIPAPLIYVRFDQVSAVVPYEVTGKPTTLLQVAYGPMRSAPVALRIVPALPAIFTADSSGSGGVAALNQDDRFNSPANPALKGSLVTFFATGEGQTNPAGVDGKLAVVPLPAPMLPVIVGIANIGAEVQYVGAAPGLVSGLLQINARVPLDAPSGPRVPLVLRVGDAFSPTGVTIAIQ